MKQVMLEPPRVGRLRSPPAARTDPVPHHHVRPIARPWPLALWRSSARNHRVKPWQLRGGTAGSGTRTPRAAADSRMSRKRLRCSSGQPDLEDVLINCLRRWSHIELSNRCGVFALDEDEHGVRVRWLVIDALLKRERPDLGDYSIQHCDPRRPATYVRGANNRRRWEVTVHPDEDAQAVTQPARIWELLSRWIAPDEAEIERACRRNGGTNTRFRIVQRRAAVVGGAYFQRATLERSDRQFSGRCVRRPPGHGNGAPTRIKLRTLMSLK
jgi:2-polyprenyl-6-methoxyphenol hydroxylase-like FAD-dependent oxidoreductase